MTEQLPFHFSLSCIGEGNGSPLQCSCVENPRDRGAWRASVYGVAQSRTQLKRLSSRSTRWSRRTCTHLLLWELQNYNSLLNNHWQENVGSHQKKIPHVQGQRRSHSKMVGGVKFCLESNPIPTGDTQRAQTKPCVHQETPQRLSHTCLCLSVFCRGTGQQCLATRGGALGATDLGIA